MLGNLLFVIVYLAANFFLWLSFFVMLRSEVVGFALLADLARVNNGV